MEPNPSRPRRSRLCVPVVGVLAFAGGLACGALVPERSGERVLDRGTDPGRIAASSIGPMSFADVVQGASPGVVTVRARVPQKAPPAEGVTEARPAGGLPAAAVQPGQRTGSGFLVNARGLVVTSRHVIAGALAIEVIVMRHGVCTAVVVGEDAATDLALLRLVDPPADLTALPIGNSEDLRAGDWIVAVGNPFGFSQTVTAGVVSFVGRHLPQSDLGVTSDFLQVSAPVNPGSSGCPVLDLAGRVVGVTTQAAEAAQGISFAVPSRSLRWALEAMEREPDGRVRRGYLGIEFASRPGVDDTGAPCEGAVILRVAEGEPAHKAGLRRGDIVLRVDGAPIPDAKILHERIVRADPGTRIALELLRDGVLQGPIDAVLGEVGGPKVTGPSN